MSWASMAKKARDVEPPVSSVPQQVVIAHDDDEDGPEEEGRPHFDSDWTNAQMRTVVDLPPFTKGLLVLDANAFIKGLDNLLDVADGIVTVSQVVAEVRDRAARDLLDRLPLKLHVIEPTKESIREVMLMAAKTGDDGTMSRTDIRLCALALDCCAAQNCLGPRIVPRDPTVNPQSKEVKTVVDEVDEDDEEYNDEDDDEEEEEEAQEGGGEEGGDPEQQRAAPTTVPAPSQAPQPTTKVDGNGSATVATDAVDDWGDDGDGEWITPANIKRVMNGTTQHNAVAFEGGVACVTSDFAMQNTLMHLGVPIVGPRGMRIHELRLWLLRCHGCYRIVTDTTKQFCPDCGSGDTLRRVNYVVHDNGEKELFINFSRRLSTRGTVFNLPKPRGGRKGTNRTLVLREDQLAHVIRGKQSSSRNDKVQRVLEDDDDELAVFGAAPIRRKFDVDAPRDRSSYKHYNVNERKKVRAARRK